MTNEKLRQVAMKLQMTPEALREHLIHSAYANAHMENESISLDMIREVALQGVKK